MICCLNRNGSPIIAALLSQCILRQILKYNRMKSAINRLHIIPFMHLLLLENLQVFKIYHPWLEWPDNALPSIAYQHMSPLIL
jgi:hypothetical protein